MHRWSAALVTRWAPGRLSQCRQYGLRPEKENGKLIGFTRWKFISYHRPPLRRLYISRGSASSLGHFGKRDYFRTMGGMDPGLLNNVRHAQSTADSIIFFLWHRSVWYFGETRVSCTSGKTIQRPRVPKKTYKSFASLTLPSAHREEKNSDEQVPSCAQPRYFHAHLQMQTYRLCAITDDPCESSHAAVRQIPARYHT